MGKATVCVVSEKTFLLCNIKIFPLERNIDTHTFTHTHELQKHFVNSLVKGGLVNFSENHCTIVDLPRAFVCSCVCVCECLHTFYLCFASHIRSQWPEIKLSCISFVSWPTNPNHPIFRCSFGAWKWHKLRATFAYLNLFPFYIIHHFVDDSQLPPFPPRIRTFKSFQFHTGTHTHTHPAIIPWHLHSHILRTSVSSVCISLSPSIVHL